MGEPDPRGWLVSVTGKPLDAAPRPLLRPRLPAELADISPETFRGELRHVSVRGGVVPKSAGPLLVDGARLARTDLSESRFDKPSLADVVFTDCNLANARWSEAALTRVEFQGCQMTGFDVNSGALLDVQFSGCKLFLSSFRLLGQAKVHFTDCEMDGTDFHGVDLRRARFTRCLLAGSLFHGARAEGLDLRGSELAGLQGVDGLRGAGVDRFQLLDLTEALAAHAGLVTLDDL
ncbi:MAG TPA: pentapeptide repeat-containing protein [Candidatus Dormibacteraeota bacterium]